MMDQKFLQAYPVMKKIEDAGYEAFFVGGSVRDYILGKPIQDVDIATSATPDEIKRIFPKTVDVGIEHGTVLVIHEGEGYEITTFRAESEYEDYRHPKKVEFIRTLEEDLKRRDFTINAIAMNKDGRVIDPFGGKRSLSEKKIKTVGNPDERFNEDALRMMRAIRFVSQLGFTLDHETFQSLKKNAHLLSKIAVERITSEFEKLLLGNEATKALKLAIEGKLHHYLPGLKNLDYVEFSNDPLFPLQGVEEKWAFLLYVLSVTQTNDFLRKWKLPVKKMKEIHLILEGVRKRENEIWTRYSLFEQGLTRAQRIERLYCVLKNKELETSLDVLQKMWNGLSIHTIKELAVSGKDLMDWTKKKGGPWVKEELNFILDGVLEGQVENSLSDIKRWWENCKRM